MADPIMRPATLADTGFLAHAILEAEKSGDDGKGLAALFDMSEERMHSLIVSMLDEEIDGCDYSISSFLIAESNGVPVATVAGWVEGLIEGLASHLLRSNLFGHVIPQDNMQALRMKRDIIAPLQIEREPMTLQIEHVFVDIGHRGQGLAGKLITAHVDRVKRISPQTTKAQVQLVANNASALRAYEKDGFKVVRTFRSDDPRVLDLLPCNVRLLLEKDLDP